MRNRLSKTVAKRDTVQNWTQKRTKLYVLGEEGEYKIHDRVVAFGMIAGLTGEAIIREVIRSAFRFRMNMIDMIPG